MHNYSGWQKILKKLLEYKDIIEIKEWKEYVHEKNEIIIKIENKVTMKKKNIDHPVVFNNIKNKWILTTCG